MAFILSRPAIDIYFSVEVAGLFTVSTRMIELTFIIELTFVIILIVASLAVLLWLWLG